VSPTGLPVVLLAALALALSACGDTSTGTGGEAGAKDGETLGVGQVRAGSVAALAQCSDWNEGDDAAKLATISDVRAQLNQAGADGPTPDLSDDEALDLFDRTCANGYAAGFRLYKLYARAASFASLGGD